MNGQTSLHAVSPNVSRVFLVDVYGVVVSRVGRESSHRLGPKRVGDRQELAGQGGVRPRSPRVKQRARYQKPFSFSFRIVADYSRKASSAAAAAAIAADAAAAAAVNCGEAPDMRNVSLLLTVAATSCGVITGC